MGQDNETPREAAKRFRRIIAMTDDKRTIEAISKLIAELESKADAAEKASGLKAESGPKRRP